MRPEHTVQVSLVSVTTRALQAMEDPKGRQGFPGAQHPPPGYQAGYPAGAPPPAALRRLPRGRARGAVLCARCACAAC